MISLPGYGVRRAARISMGWRVGVAVGVRVAVAVMVGVRVVVAVAVTLAVGVTVAEGGNGEGILVPVEAVAVGAIASQAHSVNEKRIVSRT